MVELFPANSLSPEHIRFLSSVVPQMELMVASGITLDNISDYASAGIIAFGLGEEIFNPDDIVHRRACSISDKTGAFTAKLKDLNAASPPLEKQSDLR